MARKPRQTEKFRKPIKILLGITMAILIIVTSFYVLSKFFFPCMYQMPYLTHCDNLCCQKVCSIDGSGCKQLDPSPYSTVTEYTMYSFVGVVGLLIVLLTCCSCTTRVAIEGEEQEEEEEYDDEESQKGEITQMQETS